MRRIIGVAVALALLVPVLLSCTVTAATLLHPAHPGLSSGGKGEPSVPVGPLSTGATYSFELPPSPAGYSAVSLSIATWETAPVVGWTACAGGRCVRTLRWAADNHNILVALPDRTSDGQVTVRVDFVWFGYLGYWASDPQHPRWTPVAAANWATPLARAQRLATATGVDHLGPLLVLHTVLLLGCAAYAVLKLLQGASIQDEAAEKGRGAAQF
jgi:hypothetical protein